MLEVQTRKTGWTKVAFGDVVRLSTERSRDPGAEGFERLVGLEHIDPGDLRIRRWGSVADDGTTFTNVFRPGQVLFGKRRAYQRKVAVAEFSGVCSGDIYVFEPASEQLLPELLPYICQTQAFFDHAVGTSAGSLSPRTNWSKLAAYEFDLPPVREQRRIVSALRAATSLTEGLQNMRLALQALTDAIAFERYGRLMQYTEPIALRELCARLPQSGIYKQQKFLGSGSPRIGMGELFGADVIDSVEGVERITLTDEEKTRYALTGDDLLFGRRSVVLEGAGRCVRVGSLPELTVFESSLLRVTIDSRVALPQYVFEWFRSPQGRREIRRIVTSTTVSGVSGSAVAGLPVPVMDLPSQAKAVEELAGLRSQSERLEARVRESRVLESRLRQDILESQ